MVNGYAVGLVSYVRSSISGIGTVVIASLTFSVELGMLLLAILTLFMPRRSSALAERVVIWASTCVRRLARKVVIRRWECKGDGVPHVDGREAAVCGLRQANRRDGKRGCIRGDIFQGVELITGRSQRLALRILSPTSKERNPKMRQGG